LQNTLRVLEIQAKNFSSDKIMELEKDIDQLKNKTEIEEMNTYILNHMSARIKLDLLF